MTTTRDALMRAILVEPADDTARLVIADHFEESGDPKRAEFIRVQIEMAELGVCKGHRGRPWPRPGGRCALSSCHHCRLANRALELKRLASYGRDWLPFREVRTPLNDSSTKVEKVPLIESHAVEWSRGFVSVVRAKLTDWIGRGCNECGGSGCSKCALGPHIVAEQPVVEVRTDAVADPIGDEWCWVKDRSGLTDGARILPEMFGLLEGGRLESGGNEWEDHFGVEDFWRIYPTEAAAQSALNWARREAGLPPLGELT